MIYCIPGYIKSPFNQVLVCTFFCGNTCKCLTNEVYIQVFPVTLVICKICSTLHNVILVVEKRKSASGCPQAIHTLNMRRTLLQDLPAALPPHEDKLHSDVKRCIACSSTTFQVPIRIWAYTSFKLECSHKALAVQ